MKLNYSLTAALAATFLASGLTAASAQSVTFAGYSPVTIGSSTFYFYTYDVTPSFEYAFSFTDPNVSGSGYMGPGFFVEPASTLTSYTFSSTDAEGPSALTVISNGGAVFSGLEGPAVAPAPEPSAMVSMAVLGSCLGLGILARRRKMNASAS